MKKFWLTILSLVMVVMMGLGVAGCDKDAIETVQQLTNELGIMLEGGNFEKGSILNLDKIEITEEQATKVIDKLEESGITFDDETKAYIYDLFVTKDNLEVQPDGAVKVTIPAPQDEDAEGYNVYHIKDNGVVESIPATYEDGKISFQTDGFSLYVLTPTYNCYNVTLKFDVTDIELTRYDEESGYYYNPKTASNLSVTSIEKVLANMEVGEEYLVKGILVNAFSNGNLIIRDDAGLRLEVQISNKLDRKQIYEYYKNRREQYVVVQGRVDYVQNNPTLVDATFPSYITDFTDDYVRGVTVNGVNKLILGEDYVIENNVDWTTTGEYDVTFRLIENPDVFKTLKVFVVGDSIEFNAYVTNGTLLIDGADVGIDYYQYFANGFGKVTLTAKGDDGTIFKGWYYWDKTQQKVVISNDTTYTFDLNETKTVFAEFEYVATDLYLDGDNAGFDTHRGYTEIYLPISDFVYDLDRILVMAIVKGERRTLLSNEYTIDAGGFDSENPVKGEYTVTFTYNENPDLKVTHVIRVMDEENMVGFSASADAGGRVIIDKDYDTYNKGDQVTVTVELRSNNDYEFVGWYLMDVSGAVGNECVSTDATYTVTLNESMHLYAKIEPKITYLEVDGYEGNPTRIHISKFWLADRDITVYACGALGKKVELAENEYTVDYDGLDLNAPVVGKYDVTYTYNLDTSITYTITVWVYNADYTFSATQDIADFGWLLFEGELTHEVEPYQYINGEELSITAIAEKGYTFLGWYRVINHDTYAEYELITTDETYTFIIDKDTNVQAKFGAPVNKIDLVGVKQNNNGNYAITTYKGEVIDLSNIDVYAYNTIEWTLLSANDYVVNYGGLDLTNPVAGVYTVTYTYKDNGELTDITTTLTVNVLTPTYYLSIYSEGGYVEYNGERGRIDKEFEEGSLVIVNAIDFDSYNRIFIGWYKRDFETGEWVLYSKDKNLAITVTEKMELIAKFDFATCGLSFYAIDNEDLNNKGVLHWMFDTSNCIWDEELGKFVGYGDINLIASDENVYLKDIESIFYNFRIVSTSTDGYRTIVDASQLVIDSGDYKAEAGWYEITVTYGTCTIFVNVIVM